MDAANNSNTYRVEVSGWDAQGNFFVEKTTLSWGVRSEKQFDLKSPVRDGCVIFARLLPSTAVVNNIPIAYQVLHAEEGAPDGSVRVSVTQLRPRASDENPLAAPHAPQFA